MFALKSWSLKLPKLPSYGVQQQRRKKNRRRIKDDVAERAAYVLDKSLDEQAMVYELFEAKKKEQSAKGESDMYFMKYVIKFKEYNQ